MKVDSAAVMARRNKSRKSLDDFPTPQWATFALTEIVLPSFIPISHLQRMEAWEPACNRGYMSEALKNTFKKVVSTDIKDYGYLHAENWDEGYDFLNSYLPAAMQNIITCFPGTLAIITNPPFTLAGKFIEKALSYKPAIVAMFARTALLEGRTRYKTIFEKTPPSIVGQFVERVGLVEGKCDPDVSSATAYAWFVWLNEDMREFSGLGGETRLVWIPPYKKEADMAENYKLPPTRLEARR